SQETWGGDQGTTTTQLRKPPAMPPLSRPVWSPGSNYFVIPNIGGQLFVPTNFRYTIPISVSPASVTLYSSQTQQFTASVPGPSNTMVNWDIHPAGRGSISSTGLYTAPSNIGSQQTVTVTAISAADPSKTAPATVTLKAPSPPSV